MKLVGLILCFLTATLPMSAGAATSSFANWAAVVVAGDFHAHDGGPTEAFDNARRDVSKALVGVGFAPEHIAQFSVRPELYPTEKVLPSSVGYIKGGLEQLTKTARDGCLIYFSSHGAPQGILLGEGIYTPAAMAQMVDDVCGKRPTVVILSACFAGVFLPALTDANRVVLTAARADRTSFGCSQNDRYPYYDDCIISSFPQASNFRTLAIATRNCVDKREVVEGAKPPSEPQASIGGEIAFSLPLYSFNN